MLEKRLDAENSSFPCCSYSFIPIPVIAMYRSLNQIYNCLWINKTWLMKLMEYCRKPVYITLFRDVSVSILLFKKLVLLVRGSIRILDSYLWHFSVAISIILLYALVHFNILVFPEWSGVIGFYSVFSLHHVLWSVLSEWFF